MCLKYINTQNRVLVSLKTNKLDLPLYIFPLHFMSYVIVSDNKIALSGSKTKEKRVDFLKWKFPKSRKVTELHSITG